MLRRGTGMLCAEPYISSGRFLTVWREGFSNLTRITPNRCCTNNGQKKLRNAYLKTFLAMTLLAGGCAEAPARAPVSEFMVSEKYSRDLADGQEISAPYDAAAAETTQPTWQERPWWEYYNDEELNTLIADALKQNPGINQTRKRLEQAAATARRSFSDLLPDATISGNRTTSNGDNESPSSFSLRGAASYELDLWGGNRASYEADDLAAQAAADDVRTAAITLSASIVENWLRILSLREEEALLQSQIKTNVMVLDLQHKRYENGAAQALDVLQQTEVLERARAQLPDVQAEQELVMHQLALLVGRSPSEEIHISSKSLPKTLRVPEAGVPSELLEGRPDINAAWRRVYAADWSSEAARVDRLPSFDISADYSTASTKFKNLFDIWMLDLALGLVMPLFDGGQRAAEQARTEALADERFQNYRETVLAAIGEVEDALTRNYHQDKKIKAIEKQLEVSRSALEQATISYGNGDTEYISVLNSLISVQSLEQQLVRERRDLALARVEMYRALGLRTWPQSDYEAHEDLKEEDTHG